MENWIAPSTELLPDFIIGGAMKSGTSTIHRILNQHPKVFIPKKEIGFFDIDNILEHSDFNFYDGHNWIGQFMDQDPSAMWNWYQDKFKGKEFLLKGEDSTTYLASKIAAERISLQKKEIKLIFLLRQPSLRAYSNYNHLLKSGRATHNFEDTLRFNPFTVLNRSLYKSQIENYFKLFDRSRIKIILFEELVADPELVIKDLCKFLGLNSEELPADAFNLHANKTKSPKHPSLQTYKNLIFRGLGNSNYSTDLPFTFSQELKKRPFIVKAINKLHLKVNPTSFVEPPSLRSGTKAFLDTYFFTELKGLDELLGREVLSKWF